jgi:uracil-DNA glycosylase
MHRFDVGAVRQPFRSLCESYPDDVVYPSADFRVEWGPVFHRGRLDGSARVLVIGQDPAQHEVICRRILVGEAGQRVQGFLAKAGVTSEYVMINAFLYSVYGQGGGARHADDVAIASYRNRWLDALLGTTSKVAVVLTLGTLARTAYEQYRLTPKGQRVAAVHVPIIHPTYPNSASASGTISMADAMARMLKDWNTALPKVRAALGVAGTAKYGSVLKPTDRAEIPDLDLPAGLPGWMRSPQSWASRKGATARDKRATIVVTIPAVSRTF